VDPVGKGGNIRSVSVREWVKTTADGWIRGAVNDRIDSEPWRDNPAPGPVVDKASMWVVFRMDDPEGIAL
jgi:hypothetical protein